MFRKLALFVFSCYLTLAFSNFPVLADQNDPELDILFGKLQTASSFTEANKYVSSIWEIWTAHDDPILNDKMLKGIEAMDNGDYVVAAAVFTDVIEQDPDFAEGWNKRATVYYLMGKIDASQSDVSETLLLEPRHFGALSGRGLLYSASGEPHKALQAFEEAIAVNPFMPSVQVRIESLKKMIDDQSI